MSPRKLKSAAIARDAEAGARAAVQKILAGTSPAAATQTLDTAVDTVLAPPQAGAGHLRASATQRLRGSLGNTMLRQLVVEFELAGAPPRGAVDDVVAPNGPDALPDEALTQEAPPRPQTSPPSTSPADLPPAGDSLASTELPAPPPEGASEAAAPEPAPEEAAPAGVREEAAASETPAAEGPAVAEGAGPTEGAAAEVPLLMPEPPAELTPEGQERITQVQAAARATAGAQAAMPPATEHVGAARDAVSEPPAEAAGRAQGELVAELGEQPGPSPEIEQLCETITRVIRAKRPPDEESLVKAQPDEMARDAGGQLNDNVEGDTQRVSGAYNSMAAAPQGEQTQQGAALESVPGPAPSASIHAPAAAPAPVPAENVSLDADVQASQQRMDEAGMSSPMAQEVTTGPIAEARAAQGELQVTAERDPAEVLAEQEGALAAASADLAELQAEALAALQSSRGAATSKVEGQRGEMVGTEEQMRADAGRRAEALYSQAQKDVDALLEPLPAKAMAKWEQGVAVQSELFKQQLKKVENWIKERHSGGWGSVVSVWDDLTGLPDWVTEEYDSAERAFGDGVCALIRTISADVNLVVAACQAIIREADRKIGEVYAGLPQELQGWAASEREKFQEKLGALSHKAVETRDSFNRDLVQRASQAVQDVRTQIHGLRQKAKGLIGRVVDAINAFLEDPVKAIINGLLELVGIPPASFWALVARIQDVIGEIADDPMRFANNLVEALRQGFQQFFDRFGEHFLKGLLDWLFSGLGSVGVEVPKEFSLKSVITFFLQLMGLTWPNIRKILAKHIGEQNVAMIEQAWAFIEPLIRQGPQGVFELIKEQLNPQNILDTILKVAVDFVIETLIKQVVMRVIGLLNPAGAIVQALEVIYKVLKWIFENAARIFRLIEAVVNGVSDILKGNIGGMATTVEKALAMMLVPVIDFLADFLGLGDLPIKVADAIKGFQKQVLEFVDLAIGWVVKQVKALLAKLGLSEDEDEEQANDVQARAQNALMAQVDADPTFEEVSDETESVLKQLQGEGLKSLEIEEEQGGDEYTVFGEASPRNPLVKLAPARRKTVMVVTVRFADAGQLGDDQNLRFFPREVKTGKKTSTTVQAASIPQYVGNVVKPQEDAQRVTLVTWNTGFFTPAKDSNTSHAEHQFVNWYMRQPWKGRVTEIDIAINNSPCPFCAGELKDIAGMSPLMKGKITFSKWYVNKKRPQFTSTEESLANLGPAWTVIDSSDKKKEVELVVKKLPAPKAVPPQKRSKQ